MLRVWCSLPQGGGAGGEKWSGPWSSASSATQDAHWALCARRCIHALKPPGGCGSGGGVYGGAEALRVDLVFGGGGVGAGGGAREQAQAAARRHVRVLAERQRRSSLAARRESTSAAAGVQREERKRDRRRYHRGARAGAARSLERRRFSKNRRLCRVAKNKRQARDQTKAAPRTRR